MRPTMRRLAGCLAAYLLVAAVGMSVTEPARAASVTDVPASSWAPWAACPDQPAANCAEVRAITRTADGTVFLGGSFTHLSSPDGRQRIERGNLAALLPSGEPATAVAAHTFNNPVLSLATDGSTIYAGGLFTAVDGAGASRLARFQAATGERLPFAAGINGPVHATALSGGKLFVGGRFTSVQGVARGSLAALDASTAAVDPSWAPRAEIIAGDAFPNDAVHNSVPVRSIAAAPEGSRVYVAGDLDLLNGLPRAVIAAVDRVTGATDTTFTLPAVVGRTYQGFQIAVVDGRDGRTPGVLLAAGGFGNRAFRFNLDGTVAWTVDADGDVQAAAIIGETVYLGGHFTRVCTTDCFSGGGTAFVDRLHIAAFPYTSTGSPPADTTWAPRLGPAFPPYFYGVWTLQVFDDVLHAGGVFNSVVAGGVTYAQPKYARFSAGG